VSNFLAVATVTAALHRLLQASAGADVPGATVTTERPETSTNGSGAPTVNVYLYQVVPNAALRNNDLPTRTSGGDLVRRPVAALDLHYLFTFTGAEDELEPQRLLGSVVRTLHAQPLLTSQLIAAVKTAATANPPVHPSLALTDLGDQVERVTFSPLPMNLEELSKLWSVFFQTPYALSIAYRASVVLIEPDLDTIAPLPVLDRDIEVAPLRRPFIDRVVASPDPTAPITATTTVHVLGQELRGDLTRLRLAGADRPVVSGTSIRIPLDLSTIPIADLRAGPVTIQAIHRTMLGFPPTEHVGTESNVAVFLLHPGISGTATGAGPVITVTTDLTVSSRQVATLAILDPATGERTHLLAAGPRQADATTLSFPSGGVPAGSHAVQLFIDGADSELVRNNAGVITAPLVAV
jgi:Pvc16 N-terminal domain